MIFAVIAALLAIDHKTKASRRFGDWFCAERGAGPDRNGWV